MSPTKKKDEEPQTHGPADPGEVEHYVSTPPLRQEYPNEPAEGQDDKQEKSS